MSGVLLSVSWRGRPVPRPGFQQMLTALAHRGPDGHRTLWLTWAALGHQHFWTTPEEVGEEQPLSSEDGGLCLALDGRLDNRRELLRLLNLAKAEQPTSDAALVLLAFERWGEACFERFLGPFVVVVLDLRQRRVVVSRDALGDRTLFYYQDPSVLVMASEEHVVCCHDSVSSRLDDVSTARFFALEAPASGRTPFRDVSELCPGHTLVADGKGCRQFSHWRPDLGNRLKGYTDTETVERFQKVLVESVRCRLRATSQPAVLMSGGMDSTSIAAIAARELLPHQPQGPLQTISWVFDELQLADEREYIHPVVEACGLAGTEVLGDRKWPLKGGSSGLYQGSPLDDIYRSLRTAAYDTASELGKRIVLAGTYGDNLFYGHDRWLSDLVREGRLLDAVGCLGAELGRASSLGAGLLLLRSRLARLAGWPGRRSPRPEWLTPLALDLTTQEGDEGSPLASWRLVRKQGQMALDPRIPWGLNVEAAYAGHAGLELRYPYRDRRLVELSLSLPEHTLHRPPWGKWVLRQAMAGVLPDPVRLRLHESSLHPLALRGLMERERQAVDDILHGSQATWQRFVRREWLESLVPRKHSSESDGAGALVLWLCLSWELWRRRFQP